MDGLVFGEQVMVSCHRSTHSSLFGEFICKIIVGKPMVLAPRDSGSVVPSSSRPCTTAFRIRVRERRCSAQSAVIGITPSKTLHLLDYKLEVSEKCRQLSN